jgi:ferritin-like metal-binding protein YciE
MNPVGSQPLNSFDELFIYELQDLYDAERRILQTLPKMRDAANAKSLKQVFEAHLAQTQQHVKRLEEAFRRLHRTPDGETRLAMKEFVRECEELIGAPGHEDVRDAAIIAAFQRIEHYEMAGYGTTRMCAVQLGALEIAELLNCTLREEVAADKKLTEISESDVNLRVA